MEYTKPIYDEVEEQNVPNRQTRGPIVVIVVAAIIGGGVSGCSKD